MHLFFKLCHFIINNVKCIKIILWEILYPEGCKSSFLPLKSYLFCRKSVLEKMLCDVIIFRPLLGVFLIKRVSLNNSNKLKEKACKSSLGVTFCGITRHYKLTELLFMMFSHIIEQFIFSVHRVTSHNIFKTWPQINV